MKKLLLPLAGCLALSTGTSSAQILITFTESNGDVEVNVNGTIDLSSVSSFVTDNVSDYGSDGVVSPAGVWSYPAGSYEFMYGVDLLEIDLVSGSFSSSSDSTAGNFVCDNGVFGIFGPTVNVDGQLDGISAYTGVGEWVFENQTFSAMGLDLHTADTIIDLWGATATASDSQKVQFIVSTIPEPTSTALLGLGGLGFILRRRR